MINKIEYNQRAQENIYKSHKTGEEHSHDSINLQFDTLSGF